MKTVDKILHKIKREGAVSARVLADEMGLTTMGIRQHLQAMEDEGLLDFSDIRVKVGRPTRHWSLTAEGHRRFADSHGDLAISVIDSVESLFGEAGLKKVIQQREEKTLQHYRDALKDCHNLKAKLETLAYLRESEGYMAELQEIEEGFLLIENHCPICQAAKRCPALCKSEKNIFRTVLGDEYLVTREEHIIEGQRRCTYRVQARE
ncbi:transcriptional regulator [Grimontia sp. AD028]|uniref:Transcriptional regulator n=2 Tax=Grimontia TaxID=246861 RepID=R1GZZ0_9GAMM|nr:MULTISPECIES: metalloregulator ArsR/SmtB family transcription factor [Grimontia]EOD81694.1 putative transcriptional regulator [Grimontia indica]KKD61467.1 transcriptional regulator [Grimontia sp. AD028]NGN99213.1 transcriptional regulator [Grimontia sedimenti]